MAKKKVQPRRVPHAAQPRMYGDGKPSQAADTAQRTPASTAAAPSPEVRTAGVTPRKPSGVTAGAAGSFGRAATTSTTVDYHYVINDLRRLALVAVVILALLVVLSLVIV